MGAGVPDETSAGPLFALYPLWRAVGRSGGHILDDMRFYLGEPRKDRPTWDASWKRVREDGKSGST